MNVAVVEEERVKDSCSSDLSKGHMHSIFLTPVDRPSRSDIIGLDGRSDHEAAKFNFETI